MGAKVRVNWGSLEADQVVNLYDVRNSAGRKLYVLAKNKGEARQIAHTANHIHHMIDGFSKEVFMFQVSLRLLDDLESFRPELEIAIARRLRGTIKISDEKFMVGDELIRQ